MKKILIIFIFGALLIGAGCSRNTASVNKPTDSLYPVGSDKDGLTSERCYIKGNISSSGERIYHVPSGQFYDVTQIDLSKGERWFCGEGDARTAGWRKSKR